MARLGSTIQISNSGISPGSGLGNCRLALCPETVGVPVMALGVPTVVDSSTLVADALQRAGYTEADEALRAQLEAGRSFFVAPKEIDLLIPATGVLLAAALEKAFTLHESERA